MQYHCLKDCSVKQLKLYSSFNEPINQHSSHLKPPTLANYFKSTYLKIGLINLNYSIGHTLSVNIPQYTCHWKTAKKLFIIVSDSSRSRLIKIWIVSFQNRANSKPGGIQSLKKHLVSLPLDRRCRIVCSWSRGGHLLVRCGGNLQCTGLFGIVARLGWYSERLNWWITCKRWLQGLGIPFGCVVILIVWLVQVHHCHLALQVKSSTTVGLASGFVAVAKV